MQLHLKSATTAVHRAAATKEKLLSTAVIDHAATASA
jgi:hypothetical protein